MKCLQRKPLQFLDILDVARFNVFTIAVNENVAKMVSQNYVCQGTAGYTTTIKCLYISICANKYYDISVVSIFKHF
jgi:hypothetical protein